MKSLLLILSMILVQPVRAAVQTLKPSGGQVEMLAIGKPSFIKIQGKGASPKGEVKIVGDKVTGQFEFALSSLDTGIELRNDHMKNKYLNVSQHPSAVLQMKPLTLKPGWSVKSPHFAETEFDGDLTLHGQTRPTKGKFSIDESGRVEAKLKIKLSDYKVDIPSYMGITVADDVEIKVQIDQLKVTP